MTLFHQNLQGVPIVFWFCLEMLHHNGQIFQETIPYLCFACDSEERVIHISVQKPQSFFPVTLWLVPPNIAFSLSKSPLFSEGWENFRRSLVVFLWNNKQVIIPICVLPLFIFHWVLGCKICGERAEDPIIALLQEIHSWARSETQSAE